MPRLLTALVASLLLAAPVAGLAQGGARTVFEVDPVHSSVVFKVKHFNVSYVYGRFNDVTGTFVLDEESPEKSRIEIKVLAQSVDTNNAKRDQHLRGPDFFDAKQFPAITFTSKQVERKDPHTFAVKGDLTLHGVTREVTLDVKNTGEGTDPRGVHRKGAEVLFTIKRTDYGMSYMVGPLSDEVHLMIGIEGVKKG